MLETTLPPIIPDLSALAPQSEWLAVRRFFVAGGSANRSSYALQLNAVRLLDASVHEYEMGRFALASFHARNPQHFGLIHIIEATTHFESCIWHFERFIKHARAIRAHLEAEPELKNLIPKQASFLQGAVEAKVTRLRHTLAHLHSESENIPPGESLALLPQEHGLAVGNHVITWDELVSWLTEAHICACSLVRFQPITANSTPGV